MKEEKPNIIDTRTLLVEISPPTFESTKKGRSMSTRQDQERKSFKNLGEETKIAFEKWKEFGIQLAKKRRNETNTKKNITSFKTKDEIKDLNEEIPKQKEEKPNNIDT